MNNDLIEYLKFRDFILPMIILVIILIIYIVYMIKEKIRINKVRNNYKKRR